MIFVNSMSDLFQEDIPFEFVVKVWEVMEKGTWHTFQVLTKRPERMEYFIHRIWRKEPLPNVWLGTSVENSDVRHRIDVLRNIRAEVRFISFEPLIDSVGSVDLDGIQWVIVGGESGPKSRPIEREWVDQIKEACRSADSAFFFKQWGGPNKKASGRLYRGRTWNEYPAASAQIR